jgi:hypothetical protein
MRLRSRLIERTGRRSSALVFAPAGETGDAAGADKLEDESADHSTDDSNKRSRKLDRVGDRVGQYLNDPVFRRR